MRVLRTDSAKHYIPYIGGFSMPWRVTISEAVHLPASFATFAARLSQICSNVPSALPHHGQGCASLATGVAKVATLRAFMSKMDEAEDGPVSYTHLRAHET